jgi:hypothetical protein
MRGIAIPWGKCNIFKKKNNLFYILLKKKKKKPKTKPLTGWPASIWSRGWSLHPRSESVVGHPWIFFFFFVLFF